MATNRKGIGARHRGTLPGRLLLAVALVLGGAAACGDDESSGGPGPVGPVGPVGDVGLSDQAVDAIAGSGTPVIETRDVESFDRVVLAGEGLVIVTFGDSEAIQVETDDNLIDLIETTVREGALEIRTADDVDIAPTDSVRYRVTVTDLVAVELAGAGSFEVEPWSTDAAQVILSGAGDIRIQALRANALTVEHAGVGSVAIAGSVTEQDVLVSGVGDYAAADLESENASITARGLTEATVWATERLGVIASDASTVRYYGSPDVTQDLSDLASIQSLGAK